MTVLQTIETPRSTYASQLHLYVAWGCPFCHRILASLALTGLTDHVTYTWMRNVKGPAGWQIATGDDPVFGETSLKAVYEKLEADVNLSPSVPMLTDLTTRNVLSTSSTQITRFITRGMNGSHTVKHDLSPVELTEQIDSMNAWLHVNVNRAVYQVGFATEQADYETKVARLFGSLDELEVRLAEQRYLFGDTLTESDLFLLATLARFDSVYHSLFKCSYRRIADYPNLTSYLERLQSIDGMSGTYQHGLTKEHYFLSVMHVGGEVRDLNPSRIIPVDLLNPGRASITKNFRSKQK